MTTSKKRTATATAPAKAKRQFVKNVIGERWIIEGDSFSKEGFGYKREISRNAVRRVLHAVNRTIRAGHTNGYAEVGYSRYKQEGSVGNIHTSTSMANFNIYHDNITNQPWIQVGVGCQAFNGKDLEKIAKWAGVKLLSVPAIQE